MKMAVLILALLIAFLRDWQWGVVFAAGGLLEALLPAGIWTIRRESGRWGG